MKTEKKRLNKKRDNEGERETETDSLTLRQQKEQGERRGRVTARQTGSE